MYERSTTSRRPPRRRLRIAALAVASAAIAIGPTALAQPPEIVPTYAFVREGDPVVFPRAPHGPSLADVTGVGVRGPERLAVAWFEASDDRLTVAFRLAGDEPAPLDGLVVAYEGGIVDLPVAGGTVASAIVRPSERLASPYEHHDPDAGVVGAGIVENLAPDPMSLRAIELVPQNAGSGVAVHVHEGPEARRAFQAWIDALTASLRGLAAPLPPGTAPESDLPARLASLVDEGEATVRWLDPATPALELPPGASLFWAVTPIAFPDDVRAASVTVAPRFVFVGEEERCCEVVPSAGPFGMAWLP